MSEEVKTPIRYANRTDYLDYLQKNNLILKLAAMFKAEGYKIRFKDGKIFAEHTPVPFQTWHYAGPRGLRDCNRYHSIIYKHLGFIPKRCHRCFKVVVRMKYVRQLFEMCDIQNNELNDYSSKCGTEDRAYVHGNYGAYFYTDSLNEGLDRFSVVQKVVRENSILNWEEKDHMTGEMKPTCTVILKRACTEFEHSFGESNNWKVYQDNIELEELLDKYLVPPPPVMGMYPLQINYAHMAWLCKAYSWGDPTVFYYNNNEPMMQELITYHDKENLINDDGDFIRFKDDDKNNVIPISGKINLKDIPPEDIINPQELLGITDDDG